MNHSLEAERHRLSTAVFVVGVDGSAGSERAVRWAAATAARRGRGLRLVCALDLAASTAIFGSYALLVQPVVDELRARAIGYLTAAAEVAAQVAPEVAVETELVDSGPAQALIDRSAAAYAVVLGATGAGGGLSHLGSTLLKVVAHAHGSVVVVRDAEFAQRDNGTGPVVVGVDGSAASTPALAAAFAEAAERGVDLVAVHCWIDLPTDEVTGSGVRIEVDDIDTEARSMLAEQLAGWSEKYPEVAVERKVYLSGPRQHLLTWSKTAQLVVVGNRGRGGFRGLLLGSTSNALVQRAHCPVLVTHAE
ncbi:universal stress protein [Nocardia farcinica]|uniref:universal stress protein n=1 Tax=Nocardia farcinica TaxID=37329 RepID=UPI0018953FAE|nr:universal stress protein [Nocardia farcinica]MBF6183652.1 universal stress protein [Nocardia farcinica]MBF6309495.1 universal stress protein [Nocardia farcinica]MBF6406683.1 universal stress protein [Nocardia farcinica]UEX20536.1 universal stress protein [Nocardia farcinica]